MDKEKNHFENIYKNIKEKGIKHYLNDKNISNDFNDINTIVALYVFAINKRDSESLKELNKKFQKEYNDIVSYIYKKKLLTKEILRNIIIFQNSFKITTELIILLIHNNEKELLSLIYNGFSFNNVFVTKFLYYYKHKKKLSNLQIQHLINYEYQKIGLNQCNNSSQYTPLIYAIERSNEEIVNYLIEIGINLDEHNKYGNTPLIIACEYGKENIVKCLIDHGANTNK